MIPLAQGNVPATADAVVVGGGINGLAVAYELAGLGLKRVVVLEKGYLGAGSTGRCGGGIRQRDVAVMTRELSTLLNAGLNVDQALSFLLDVTQNERLRRLLVDLLEKVQGGSMLASALEDHKAVFSNAYIGLVRAGESGNALNDVLARLDEYLDSNERLNEQVKSALVYPIMLMVMASISIVVLLAFVVPQFTPLFESAGAELPTSIISTPRSVRCWAAPFKIRRAQSSPSSPEARAISGSCLYSSGIVAISWAST